MVTRILGSISQQTRELLRRTLLRSHASFAVYEEIFGGAGITSEDILEGDPLAVLQSLPPLQIERFYELVDQSFAAGSQIVDMETSSGTTGPKKRRLISHADDVSETTFLAEMFRVCGIGASDSVACVDTGPLTLMVSFTRALEGMGVAEAYAYSAGPDAEAVLEQLAALAPTVMVSIPSILDRLAGALRESRAGAVWSDLRAVVYVGEPLSSRTRFLMEHRLGVEVFGYYGASETSALGIECRNHDGIHLFTDRNIIELASPDPNGHRGELLVTTLRQEAMPLIRYALKDMVEVIEGDCPCGLDYPRLIVRGRIDGTVSIMGSKFSYTGLLDAAYRGLDVPRLMEVVLTRNGLDKLTLVLPRGLEERGLGIRRTLLGTEVELGFLVGSRLLDVELDFVEESYFTSTRKTRRIVDRRLPEDEGGRLLHGQTG